jgi:alpha-L-fucosidase 2
MKLLLTRIGFLICCTASSPDNPSLKLWYNQPAGKGSTAVLPVGNGRLGAMVYGDVEKETIQLNEATVWTGSPNRNDNPDALASLLEIRKLVFQGRQKEVETLAGKTIRTKESSGQMYKPVGNLVLYFAGHEIVRDKFFL